MAQVATSLPTKITDSVTSTEVKDAAVASGPAEPVFNGNTQYQRRLGDSEQSYYLPSRADGVNDMYDIPRSSSITIFIVFFSGTSILAFVPRCI